jgi:hypothetical protein
MKFAVCSDVHLRNYPAHAGAWLEGVNDRYRGALSTLRRALETAQREKCVRVFVAGDVFDAAKPSAPEVRHLVELLAEFPDFVTLLLGNHDASGASEEWCSALALLDRVCAVSYQAERVTLTAEGEDPTHVTLLPFQPLTAEERLRSLVALGPTHYVVGHISVFDDTFPDFLRGPGSASRESMTAALTAVEAYGGVFGDYHAHTSWTREDPWIVQGGTLSPGGWDDAGENVGGLTLVDTTEAIPRVETIPGPRFMAFDFLAELNAWARMRQSSPCTYYVRVRVPNHAQAKDARDVLTDLVAAGVVRAFEVVLAADQARTQLRDAVRETASKSGLEQVVSSYCATVPMPPGVSRDSARSLVLELFRKARAL